MKKYRLRIALLLVVLCCAVIPQAAMAIDCETPPNAFAGATASGSASTTGSSWGLLWYFLSL